MSNEEIYDDDIEDDIEEDESITIVEQKGNGELKRKILTFGLIIIIAFAAGSAIVGFSLMSNENSPRKDLANTDFYLRNIFNNLTIGVFNKTSERIRDYSYDYNNSAGSTFLDIGGAVVYNDEQENLEYMKIFFNPSTTDLSIESVFFRLSTKSQLNIIILSDGREVFNALSIKFNIDLDFQLFSSEIVVYVF